MEPDGYAQVRDDGILATSDQWTRSAIGVEIGVDS